MALSNKDPREKVVITFDFTAVPETVSNPVVTITEKGDDVDLVDLKVDIPQVLSNKIMQLFTGGEDGKQYTVSCLVDVVATGEKFIAKDTLNVKK